VAVTVFQRKDGWWQATLCLGGRRRAFYGRTKQQAQDRLSPGGPAGNPAGQDHALRPGGGPAPSALSPTAGPEGLPAAFQGPAAGGPARP